jgi:hypothetical protein
MMIEVEYIAIESKGKLKVIGTQQQLKVSIISFSLESNIDYLTLLLFLCSQCHQKRGKYGSGYLLQVSNTIAFYTLAMDFPTHYSFSSSSYWLS